MLFRLASVFSLFLLFQVKGSEIEFNRDIRPLLSSKCFACHGADATHAEGHLRLDSLEAAIKGGDSENPSIIPHNADGSELVKRIFSEDVDDVMPPPDFHASLTLEEKNLLKEWINQGGEYQQHWAFITPVKVSLPEVVDSTVENPIDRFISAGLNEKGKRFSDKADKAVLARRLFLDLTGLPPSYEELAHYQSLDEEVFSAAITEDLLNSPHYGERMALDWMDASRYADTHGNSRDGTRFMWLWRDWVIKAFNENMPYDQFIKEQIAGDLLENPSDGQLIATGFNRLHPIIQEGGTIPEENLTIYAVDRVKTVGESILGVTMACAQCHDHKYDPISQREYFEFYAFFNTLDDKGIDGGEGRNAKPMIQALSPLRNEEELAVLKVRRQELIKELEIPMPEAQNEWVQKIKEDHLSAQKSGFKTASLTPLSASTPSVSDPVVFEPNGVYKPKTKMKPLSMAFKIPDGVGSVSGLKLTFLPGDPVTEAEQSDPKKKIHSGITVRNLSASFGAAFSPTLDLNNIAEFTKVSASSCVNWDKHAPYNASLTTYDWVAEIGPDKTDSLTFTLKEPISANETPFLSLEMQILWDRARSFTLEVFSGEDPESAFPAYVLAGALKEEGARSVDEESALKTYFEKLSAEKSFARYALENVNSRIKFHEAKHNTMVMDVAETPRKTYILNRGLYSDPTEEVTAKTPAIFPPINKDGAGLTRLDLAEWFISKEHPLTSRVVVNRIWAQFFGRGLSEALADFGSQGTYPSYPELLDWLAVDFQENGWDVKRLVRQIVSSQAYQQSSNSSAEDLRSDPKNVSLARGPRFRVQAEFIRDIFLKSSGLLQPYIGGESVNPYQPGDLWRQVSHYGSVPHHGQTFLQDHGMKLYRRSIYTFWKRTLPPPNMVAFDAPNREICSIGRSATNTPLQALVLLNDPQFVEAARAFAERLVNEGGDDVERLAYAFQHITSQKASADQIQTLVSQLSAERTYFNESGERALGLITAGEKPLSVHPESHAELAAWTNTVSLIYNLSQTITRN